MRNARALLKHERTDGNVILIEPVTSRAKRAALLKHGIQKTDLLLTVFLVTSRAKRAALLKLVVPIVMPPRPLGSPAARNARPY